MERRLEDDDGHRAIWVDPERDEDADAEHPSERFDRIAFALHAIDLLKPRGVRVAVAPTRRRLSVAAGRTWGTREQAARWALVAVPPHASRRSIALAVASLGQLGGAPYALDVLLGKDEAAGETRQAMQAESGEHRG